MNQARAILWGQWRSLRNSFLRRGIGWSAFVGVIWYGFWIAAAFAVMLLTSSPLSASLSGVFLLIFLYWQVVPVLMAASGASLDLRKLQAYPVPIQQFFALEVMLRVTVAVEVILVLIGGATAWILGATSAKDALIIGYTSPQIISQLVGSATAQRNPTVLGTGPAATKVTNFWNN